MVQMPERVGALARAVIAGLIEKGASVSTAESCTGGLIAAALTSVAGSSAVVHGGFVTYANEAKVSMLGVRPETLETFGAVSEQTAREMAEGAWERTGTAFSISVTGIAGPDGGTPGKPVGLVWFGLAASRGIFSRCMYFKQDQRDAIRQSAVEYALQMLLEVLRG